MNRLVAVFLAAALAFACAACKSSSSAPPQASTGDFKGEHKIRFQEEAPPPAESSGGSKALAWAATPFENIVYLPWKFVGGALKGVADGVSAGFGKDSSGNPRMPIMGVLFSPVNAVLGLGTGAVEGLAIEPVLLGPDDGFGHAMSQPMRHPTSIWWY